MMGEENRNSSKRNCLRRYGSLFWEFFKIGLFTIGGGVAMIPQIQQVVVQDKGWLTDEEMIDCIAVSQAMPGVIAINSATYIGRRTSGIPGAAAATLGVVMPSFLIIILVVTALGAVGDNPYITGAFTGIKAAVCGLILVTVVKLGRQLLTSAFQWALAIAAFLAIGVFGITAIWAIVAGAIAGMIYTAVRQKSKTGMPAENDRDDAPADENGDGEVKR